MLMSWKIILLMMKFCKCVLLDIFVISMQNLVKNSNLIVMERLKTMNLIEKSLQKLYFLCFTGQKSCIWAFLVVFYPPFLFTL